MKKNKLLLLIIVVLFIQCKKDDTETTYEVTFDINWNAEDFPVKYPSNPHFSKIIGWSHSSSSDFFALGTMASEGIKEMAELGSTEPLSEEINDKIKNKEGYKLVVGDNLGSGVGKITVEIEVNKQNPSITLATMIAPSPDWYIAVVNVNLFEGNEFVSNKTIDASIYDAGTDNGTDYTSADEVTNPQQNISILDDAPLSNGLTLSTVTFTKK